ncbi:ecto-ADP-ribosyltransferase 5-like [Hyperolius riggenbachi]|uniref:ecto-ADP-ribosyltransferase 5-like n=1 Tax=Hyperolius riggenbachi TaxID=752182 RepID=UPI0035A364F2
MSVLRERFDSRFDPSDRICSRSAGNLSRMRTLPFLLCLYCLMFGFLRTQKVGRNYLTMYSDAFDDQYENCTEEMEESINRSLLKKEKSKNEEFEHVWKVATQKWREEKRKVPHAFKEEYGIALMAYTMETKVYRDFNEAVRNYKDPGSFKYHSLHFFLTRAVTLLRSSRRCVSENMVYRGIKDIHLYPDPNGGTVRFGQFTSTSKEKKIAQKFGTATFFNISTCFGAKIGNYSFFSDENEVLVPADEVFSVESFEEVGGNSTFILKSTRRRCHYYNCHYLEQGRKSAKCVQSKGEYNPPPRDWDAVISCLLHEERLSTSRLLLTMDQYGKATTSLHLQEQRDDRNQLITILHVRPYIKMNASASLAVIFWLLIGYNVLQVKPSKTPVWQKDMTNCQMDETRGSNDINVCVGSDYVIGLVMLK